MNGVIRAKKSTDAGISWTTYDLTNPAGSGAFDTWILFLITLQTNCM